MRDCDKEDKVVLSKSFRLNKPPLPRPLALSVRVTARGQRSLS